MSKRTLVVVGIAAVVLLGACGGGSSKKSSPSDTTGGAGADVTTTSSGSSGGNGTCFTDPGTQHAKVRFVNFFTNSTYPTGDIDVWQGSSGTDPCGKKLATVGYGKASDYVDVTASDSSGNWSVTGYIAGSTADDHSIITQTETWKGGEQVTIMFMPEETRDGNTAAAGADESFFESHSDVNDALDVVPGKALIGIAAAAVQFVDKDGAWVAGAGGTCFAAKGDTENTRTNIGGTSLVPYPVDPGTIDLGLYKSQPGTCTGTPDLGPVSIDAAAGSRTLVLAYGPDTADIKLLVLPVAAVS